MIEYSYTNNLNFVSARPVAKEHRNGLGDIHFTFGDRTYYASLEEVAFMTKCLKAAVYDHRANLRKEANTYLDSIGFTWLDDDTTIYVHPCDDCGVTCSSLNLTFAICFECSKKYHENDSELVS